MGKFIIALFRKKLNTEFYKKYFNVPPGEVGIKWLDDPKKYYFVRTRIFYSKRKDTGPGDCTSGRVIGYSILGPDAKQGIPGYFVRRYFYLSKIDLRPDCIYYKVKHHPGEGVTPTTVKPGIWGTHIQPNTQKGWWLI